MESWLCRFCTLFLCITVASILPAPVYADAPPRNSDELLNYFGTLDYTYPALSEFALGEPMMDELPWQIAQGNELLDTDPFSMQKQTWQPGDEACAGICYKKTAQALRLTFADETLTLDPAWTPFLETQDYVLMTSDQDGFYFLAKKDIALAKQKHWPMPIFYFDLPGDGWVGTHDQDIELAVTDQIVIFNQNNFALPIDVNDLALVEKIERINYSIAQAWSVLRGDVHADGLTLPMSGATLHHGLLLSGQMPQALPESAMYRPHSSIVAQMLLPPAAAEERKPTWLKQIRELYRSRLSTIEAENVAAMGTQLDLPLNLPTAHGPAKLDGGPEPGHSSPAEQFKLKFKFAKKPYDWKAWIGPAIQYGSTAALVAAAGPHIDWSSLITSDLPKRVETVAMILAGVLGFSVILKYTAHRALFDAKYARTPHETWGQRLNKEHKGILDEYLHANWFSYTITGQSLRHGFAFLKDRWFGGSRAVQTSWEATVGYMIKTSSHIAVNWKVGYFGWLFGAVDATLNSICVLVFVPALILLFHMNVLEGADTAKFVSFTILSQFLLALQQGPHQYAQDIKMIHLGSAELEARRRLKDPDSLENEQRLYDLTMEALERRNKAIELPTSEEFIYDPLTFLHGATNLAGFSIDSLSAEQKAELTDKNLILRRSKHGLIKPSFQRALKAARLAQNTAPSVMGAKVIQLFEWALSHRSLTQAVAGRAWDVLGSDWANDEMKEALLEASKSYLQSTRHPTVAGLTKATLAASFKFLAVDSTQEVRDLRLVATLMSTGGGAQDMLDYLPQSWIERAGSREAGELAAEIFHQAFHSYLIQEPSEILPDDGLSRQYSVQVEGELSRLPVTDSFTREIRRQELTFALRNRERKIRRLDAYNPFHYTARIEPETGALVRAWENTREAVSQFSYQLVAGRQWQSVREASANVPEGSPVYRMIVARKMAEKQGLWVEDPENSEFVRKVLQRALSESEEQREVPEVANYRERLATDADREFYDAQSFYTSFVNNYIDMSVHTDLHLSAASPEFPGRAQKLRRNLIGVPGGEHMSKAIRYAEAFWRNDETAYMPGLSGFLDRNIPFFPDVARNFGRSLRYAPYMLTATYATNYLLWQQHIPYPLYATSFLLESTNVAFVEVTNRIQRFQDRKPMERVPHKLNFTWTHSLLTNSQSMFEEVYAQSITNACEAWL